MFDWYKEEVVPGWDDYCEPKCCTWELVRQRHLQAKCGKKLELIIAGDLGVLTSTKWTLNENTEQGSNMCTANVG